jgi:hypothetical protein
MVTGVNKSPQQLFLQTLFKNMQKVKYKRIFTLLTGSTSLHFTATVAPPAAKRIRILPMNQHA